MRVFYALPLPIQTSGGMNYSALFKVMSSCSIIE